MTKIITSILIALAGLTAFNADAHGWHRGGYYRGNCWGCGWAPLTAGVVIGAELARPYPYSTVIVNEPVYVQPQPVLEQPPLGYHWQEMIDPTTNTKKIVLVPNQ